MKLFKILTASCLLVLASLATAQVEWLPPGSHDLTAGRLDQSVASLPASRHHESAPVNFAWSPNAALAGRPASAGPADLGSDRPRSTSQGYWLDVSGAELAAGIDLPVSAPGAVVRISALEQGKPVSLDPDRLELALNGRAASADFGPAEMATGRDMRAQGMRVPEASLAFRLGRDSAAGTLTVRHPGIAAEQALVIHVHEPQSAWVARLSLPRQSVLSGQAVDFDLSLDNARQSLQPSSIQAVLVSPDASQSWPLTTRRSGQLSLVAAPLAQRSGVTEGLYEAHVYLEAEVNGITVRRDLTLALAIAPAIARFNGQVSRARSAGLALTLGVETAASGRYQVNAELMGTNKRGQLEPVAYVQSAAVLTNGPGQIRLEIDQDLLGASGLTAPFEVHNLMLLDQGRMHLLEHRERALRIGQR